MSEDHIQPVSALAPPVWFFGACSLIAAAISVYGAWQDPSPHWTPAGVGGFLGTWVVSAVIPIVVWGVLRFRREGRGTFFALWGVLVIVVASLGTVGAVYERHATIQADMPGGHYSGEARNAFVRSAMQPCVTGQRQNAINVERKITEKQITGYCECASSGMADVMTPEWAEYIDQNHALSPAMNDAMVVVARRCAKSILGSE